MIIDWEKEQERMVYPQGTYKVVIDSWERATAKTGTEQIRWKAKIIEPEEHKDRGIVEHNALTEKAIWRLQKMVSALGVDAKALGKCDTTSPQFEKVLNICVGRNVHWLVAEENDLNGLPRNSIKDYVPDLSQEKIGIEQGAEDGAAVKWDE